MTPRALKNFLTSKFGLFLGFVAIMFSAIWVYGRSQSQPRASAAVAGSGTPAELGKMAAPLNEGLESGVPQSTDDRHKEGKIVPFRPAPATTEKGSGVKKPTEPAKPKKIRYASLLAAYDPTPARPSPEAAPKRIMPFGTLLKCKLVNTVDSANLETPVIAVLLEDVWQNGVCVVPANTLVHGTARAGRLRDRVSAAGTWRFVWQDGRELAFNGIALDRAYDHDIDGYGITDGSAGLKGRLIAADDLQELKLLASAALSGFARGTQDRTQTAFGTTITGSISNGVREGTGEVFDLYAQRVLKDIEQNGYFVRVPAGKEFYVYVTEAVNPEKAKVAGGAVAAAPPTTSEPSPNSATKTKG